MAFASPPASHALFWNVLLVLLSLDESHVFSDSRCLLLAAGLFGKIRFLRLLP